MVGVSKLSALALVSGVAVSMVACGRQPPQELGAANAPDASTGSISDHPRVLDTQRSRLFSAQIGAEKQIALRAARNRHALQPESANPNFTIVTTTPVVGAVSIYGQSFYTESDADQMFFGTQGSGVISSGLVGGCTGCGSHNFFAVTNLHKPTGPNISWSASVSGGTSASNAMSASGNQIYVLSDNGNLYCFQTANGSTCSGWTNPPAIALTGTAITPWVETAGNAVYVNDGGGNIYRFNATSGGTKQWSYNYASTGSKSWPLEANNIIYVGDGAGNLWRIVDPGAGTAPTTESSVALSGLSSSCASASNVSIDGSVSLDSSANLVFLSWQGCIYSFPHFCAAASGCTVTSGTWGTSTTVVAATSSVPDKTFQTWPALDGSYAHWVIADKPTSFTDVSAVWTAPYALSTVAGTALVNASSTVAGASLGSAPVIWGGDLYVGDQSGYVEEFGCATTSASAVSFLAETNAAAGTINSPIVLDDATGNIEYGFNDGVVQFPLWEGTSTASFTWSCPSGMVACNNQQCGTGPDSTQCVPTAECNTGAGCSTVAAAGATVQVASGTEGASVAGTQGSGGNQICPTGTVILGVLGASYGTPPASDDSAGTTFNFASGCYAADSLSVTESNCPLNTEENCTFSASSTTFGDPCVGTTQNYYGWFACGATAGSVPVLCSRQNVTPTTGSDPCAANPDGGAATCQGTCVSGWGDCNANLQYDGCETYVLGSDTANCGFCGNECSSNNATASCTAGACQITCNSGYGNCDGEAWNGCEDFLLSDPNNCGGCGIVCLPGDAGAASCSAGVCSNSAGLVASYPLTEGAGSTTADVTGNGHTGTLGAGAVWSDPGVAFAGASNAYIQAGGFSNSNSLGSAATPLSIAVWVNPSSTAGGTIVEVSDQANMSNWCIPFLGFNSSGQVVAQMWNGSAQAVTGSTIPTNTWSLLTMTYSTSAGLMLYVNTPSTSTALSYGPLAFTYSASGNSDFVTFGSDLGVTRCEHGTIPDPSSFDGTMDLMKIYDIALTQSQVTALAASPPPTPNCMSGLLQCGTNCCSAPTNASATCTGGTTCGFACNTGWGNCDDNASNGCEDNLETDAKNCGACGSVCAAGDGAPTTCSAGACASGPTGLIAEYPLSEGSGTTTADVTGDGHTGTLVGATWNSTGGVTVAGTTSSYIQAGGFSATNSLGSSTTPLTISLWVYPTSVAGGTIVDVSEGANGVGGWCTPFIGFTSTGQPVAQLWNGGADVAAIGASAIPTNAWTMLTMTYSTTDGLILYVNGTNVASAGLTYSASGASDYVTFGANLGQSSCTFGSVAAGNFTGTLDLMKIYNVELSAGEVATLAAAPPPSAPTCSGGAVLCSGTCCPAQPGGGNDSTTCNVSACAITCNTGFGNCDDNWSNGCETNTTSSGSNCGTCGVVCVGGGTCTSGVCSGSDASALVADYPLTEGSGTTTADVSGNGHTGALVGTTWNSSGGVTFAGSSSSYLQAGNFSATSSLGSSTTPVTISVWVYPTAKTGTIIDLSSTADGSPGWCIPILGFDGSGNIEAQLWNGSATVAATGATIPLNTWTLLTMTYSNATNTVILYENGSSAGTSSTFSYTASGQADYLTFGSDLGQTSCAHGNISAGSFAGTMDLMKVYNVALTASDVATIYSAGAPP